MKRKMTIFPVNALFQHVNSLLYKAQAVLFVVFIILFSGATTLAQCPAGLTVTAGNTGTWVNTSGSPVTVRITAVGAGGGKNTANNCTGGTSFNGGSGASMRGDFTVAAGASILLIAGSPGGNSVCSGSGGGGSGAVNCGNPSNCGTGTILLIAGGGGGTSGFVNGGGGRATSSTGNGGGNNNRTAAGGGGLNSAGTNGTGATVNAGGGGQVSKTDISIGGTAGNGGVAGATGGNGMGGGGGTASGYAAGGGGQTGGNGEDDAGGNNGGYSLPGGTNQVNTAGTAGGGANAGSVTLQCLSVLPVELISFKATPQYQAVKLNWETAEEVNNIGFHIERQYSINGKWDELSFVKAKGSGSTYEFTDNNPLSVNYYRLRQRDNDGKETLSKVISVSAKGNNKLKVHPNPVSNTLSVENTEGGDYQIINLLGQEVMNGKAVQRIDVSALPEGTYFLKVGVEQVKFVKQ